MKRKKGEPVLKNKTPVNSPSDTSIWGDNSLIDGLSTVCYWSKY